MLIDAWPRLLAADPQLVLVLAPRHPERFTAVAASSINPGTLGPGAPIGQPNQDGRDTRRSGPVKSSCSTPSANWLRFTRSPRVAFVGGSLVPAGGHNPLEPAQFAVPIVMGPHYANFAAITDSLREPQRAAHCCQRRSGLGPYRTAPRPRRLPRPWASAPEKSSTARLARRIAASRPFASCSPQIPSGERAP